ncbi:outer membrane protein assembly factor BamE domain-containing protein [Neisseria wadsworthii]|uniref:Lipoprotein Mlp n=1 Tax=Neisseria wadsworthii 9715 TaxID=1030841 RepID=G4CPT8_9NEIS|nr:outer membrane protein assembly factor BamE [Neisseria wadsworthii]EGZ47445.1 lipoprotein Mlp [Neisseria wadsworthii 9715]QMT34886.1 outer membrane protein assembly factor BamE [Neisseria wadsworthii]
MKHYLILTSALLLSACAQKPQPQLTVRTLPVHTSGKKYEVTYKQKAYKVNHILKWRTVNDPNLGIKPDWDKLNQIRPGMNAATVQQLLGKPWHHGSSYLTEWNYLYRYAFSGKMQQCQYKIVFNKKSNTVEGIFWEPVAHANCRH